MRWIACAAALVVACQVACQKEPAPTPAPSPTPAPVPPVPLIADAGAAHDAGAAQDAGSGGLVRLLPGVISRVTVASDFGGADGAARALFDGKPDTVWQSAFDDPSASWILIPVPPTATIEELHVATVSPLTELTLVADGRRVAAPPDPARQGLSIVRVHAERWLLVAAAKRGPIGYAELEAWGKPKAGYRAPTASSAPLIEVDSPPVSPAADPCAPAMAERAKFINEHQNDVHEGPGGEDHSYPPTCEPLSVQTVPGVDGLDPAWSNPIGWCDVQDEIYGPATCNISFKFRHTAALVSVEQALKSARIDVMSVATPTVAGEPWLLVRFTTTSSGPAQYVIACRPDARPTCAAPIEVGGEGWAATVEVAPSGDALMSASGASGNVDSPPLPRLGQLPLDFSGKRVQP